MRKRLLPIIMGGFLLLAIIVALRVRQGVDVSEQVTPEREVAHDATPLSPQNTPVPPGTEGDQQTATAVPQEIPSIATEVAFIGEGIAPFPGAPPCPDHDPTVWHGLWDSERGCHYDHSHNHDPFATVFAEQVQSWEQVVSYPWQTPHENEHKHTGYKYIYVQNPQCATLESGDNCLKYALIQLHAIGSIMDTRVRFHSFRAVALLCDPTGDNCGLAQTGGWGDFGLMHCGYKKEHCPLDTDPPVPTERFDLPPYRTSAELAALPRILARGRNVQYWNSGVLPRQLSYYPDPYNQIFEYDWQTYDAWDMADPDDLETFHFVCADQPDCHFNHSTMRMYEIIFRVPDQLGGGRITFNSFTDLKGNIDTTCTAPGPACVPFILDNVPAGSATYRVPVGNVPITEFDDYDIYFCGERLCGPFDPDARSAGWIKYPN